MGRIATVLFASLAAALAWGCPGGAGGGSPGARAGATFIFARGSDSVLLDPQKVDDGESVLIAANVFDSLVRYGRGSSVEIEPALATRWERSEDGREWTFDLREGVKFHDGTPFDADAVVFAFERIIRKDHPLHDAQILNESRYKDIESVEKVGPHRVRFRLRRPVAPSLFLGSLTVYTAFIPSPSALRADPEGFGRRPVGTGPFRFASWEADQRIVLERNPEWWGAAPRVERVVALVVKENSARRNMLEAGEVHAIDGVNPIDVDPLSKNPAVRVLVEPGMSVGYLAMNTRRPPLDDPAVRARIARAIDREKIVRLNFHGRARAALQVTPPTIFDFGFAPPAGGGAAAAAAAPLPASAREGAPAQAGAAPLRRLALWAMPNPRPYMPEPKKTAELLKQDLARAGIEVEIVTYPWDVYLAKTRQGEHDLCLLGWTADVADPDDFLFTFFAGENLGGTNVSFYENAEVQTGLLSAQVEPDAARRRAIYRAIEETIAREAPLLPLAHASRIHAVRAEVEGFESHPTGRVLFDRVALRK